MFRKLSTKSPINLSTDLPSMGECIDAYKKNERAEALKLLRRRSSWDVQSVFIVLVLSMITAVGSYGHLVPYFIGGVFAYSWFESRSLSRRLDALIVILRDNGNLSFNEDDRPCNTPQATERRGFAEIPIRKDSLEEDAFDRPAD